MAKIITIYCEGVQGGHDHDIIEKIVYGISDVLIKPIGGKRGAGAIIEFTETLATKSDFYLFFRDRDFDCPISQEEKLHKHNTKTYFGSRTTIENYLFDISLFYQFTSRDKLVDKYKINSEKDVADIFIDTAKELKNYQAVRHTLGELREHSGFETTWVKKGSGYLPDNLDFEFCKKEGWALIDDMVSKNNRRWTKHNFQEVLDKYLAMFDDDFFKELKFLICFQGKDFAQAITKRLPEFPMDAYYKFAKENFDYKKFGDLRELRIIIERGK